ncbi:MAG: secretion system protein E, partial [Archaeoglobales archaeon]|nr:secretion system protein E [Archaeoglobales archaeon]
KDQHSMVGASKALEDIRRHRGWSLRELNEELERRRSVLEFMVSNGIRSFKEVSTAIHMYQVNPDRALRYLGVQER